MPDSILAASVILIVDDEPTNVRLLEVFLKSWQYTQVYSTTDSRLALDLFRKVKPDIILLDLSMPHIDGFALMARLNEEMGQAEVPILVLTADSGSRAKHRALREGASDFLTKPLDEVEVRLRVRNLLLSRMHTGALESRIEERNRALEDSWAEAVQRLALAAEYRDDDTGLHTKRVGQLSANLARLLERTPAEIDLIRLAAPLHDLGKIGIPDAVLLKPGKLTREEFDIIKTHTTIGANVLSGSTSDLLQLAAEIALNHHERWDGTGYFGLVGSDIPISARVVAVADVFDALTHRRPYKEAWPFEDACKEIRSQSGRQFDPDVVAAFDTLMLEGYNPDEELTCGSLAAYRSTMPKFDNGTVGPIDDPAVAANYPFKPD